MRSPEELREEDVRRETFLKATVEKMADDSLILPPHQERVAEWLRTVWLEAREETWGENAMPTFGAEVWGAPDMGLVE